MAAAMRTARMTRIHSDTPTQRGRFARRAEENTSWRDPVTGGLPHEIADARSPSAEHGAPAEAANPAPTEGDPRADGGRCNWGC